MIVCYRLKIIGETDSIAKSHTNRYLSNIDSSILSRLRRLNLKIYLSRVDKKSYHTWCRGIYILNILLCDDKDRDTKGKKIIIPFKPDHAHNYKKEIYTTKLHRNVPNKNKLNLCAEYESDIPVFLVAMTTTASNIIGGTNQFDKVHQVDAVIFLQI